VFVCPNLECFLVGEYFCLFLYCVCSFEFVTICSGKVCSGKFLFIPLELRVFVRIWKRVGIFSNDESFYHIRGLGKSCETGVKLELPLPTKDF